MVGEGKNFFHPVDRPWTGVILRAACTRLFVSSLLNEPAHLAAGIRHWQSGEFGLYCVNPPLVRMIAALPVLAAGVKTDWHRLRQDPTVRYDFVVGDDLIAANGERSFFLFMIARWACIPFAWIGGPDGIHLDQPVGGSCPCEQKIASFVRRWSRPADMASRSSQRSACVVRRQQSVGLPAQPFLLQRACRRANGWTCLSVGQQCRLGPRLALFEMVARQAPRRPTALPGFLRSLRPGSPGLEILRSAGLPERANAGTCSGLVRDQREFLARLSLVCARRTGSCKALWP